MAELNDGPRHQSGTFMDPDVVEAGVPIRLRASRCERCHRWEFPARGYCPGCAGATVTIAPLSGSGRVEHVTAVLHAPPGSLVEAPYAVAMVAFPEGLSILGAIPDSLPDDLHVGQELRTVSYVLGGRVEFVYQPVG